MALGQDALRRVVASGRINGFDDTGNSPLHLAVSRGYGVDTATLLVGLGADLNARNHVGRTPLHLAVARDAQSVALYLVEAGADIHARDTAGVSPVIRALESGTQTVQWFFTDETVLIADSQGNTPLHLAAAGGYESAISPLLSIGADPRARNLSGQTPTDLARQNDNESIVRMLSAAVEDG
jgi:hypothetical protein